MRMVTITIAAAMLLMGVPAYAHDVPDPIDERGVKTTTSYTNSLTVEDDLRVQPGWWGDDGIALNTSEGPEPEVSEQPEWVWVQNHDANVDVTVSTHGALAGAVDVFKYRLPDDDTDAHYTPNCPQELVEDQYPETLDGAGIVSRVARETLGYHQRAGSAGELPSQADDGHIVSTMDLTLDMSRTQNGYLVVFYPLAATGMDEVEAQTGESSMWWTLESQQDEMTLVDNLQHRQSDLPFETHEWAGETGDVFECADRLIVPPEVPQDGAAVPDLPGAGPDAGDLMDASLPE